MRGPSHLSTRRYEPATAGTTLVELLASMAILSVLLVVLGLTLEVALGKFRSGAEWTENQGGADSVATRIEDDLASHCSSRPANLPRLPEGTPLVQRAFFENRLFLPFEINRSSGTGMAAPRSFQNAAPEFDSLAFATSQKRAGDNAIESGPAIVGYYVAYTRDSPLAGDDRAGMKLFRHFRPSRDHLGDGYAAGLILHCSYAINDAWDEEGAGSARPLDAPNSAALRRGRFNNDELPFLLSRRFTNLQSFSPVAATQPWPTYPIPEYLAAPPSTLQPERASAEVWKDPGSSVHDSVFPDEAICDHVVRFELKPYRRITLQSGASELMGASALNRHLGLSGGEDWPVLVTPDFIDLRIATISEKTALTLSRYEDWLIDWEDEGSESDSSRRQQIERDLQIYHYRMVLPRRSI